MDQQDWLADRFEQHRSRLRAVAYRMLGSLSEADDAVQEAWLRFSRADTSAVEDLGAWLTTVVARICLNSLRSRKTRREEPIDAHMPDPIVSPLNALGPEDEALLADSVGLALLIVLDTLAPAERLAFVLHDVFDVPFEQIASILDRSEPATRQLASRARRRLSTTPTPEADLAEQWELVDAFLAAARDGNFDRLLSVLDPDVVLRADGGATGLGGSRVVRGAHAVASGAATLIEGAFRLRGRTPPVCREMVRTMLHGHHYDGSRATRELGLSYTPVAETFRRTINWAVTEGLVTRPLPRDSNA